MSKTPEINTDWITSEIIPRLAHAGACSGPWTVCGPLVETRNGKIFKATCPACEMALAIKHHRRGVSTNAGLERQYENLTRYFQAMPKEDGCMVPQLVWVDAKLRVAAMEWIDEPQMSGTLLRAGFDGQARREQFTKAGRWLRVFHTRNPITSKPFNAEKPIRLIEKKLAEVPGEAQGLWAFRRLAKCTKAIGRHCSRFQGVPLEHGRVHGDFTPTNIFAGADRTVGIDFLPAVQAPLATDICRFMAYADVYKYAITMPWHMDHTAGDRRDLEAFLDGYGTRLVACEGPMMTFLQLLEISRRIATRGEVVVREGANIGRITELYRLVRRGGYLIKRLDKSG